MLWFSQVNRIFWINSRERTNHTVLNHCGSSNKSILCYFHLKHYYILLMYLMFDKYCIYLCCLFCSHIPFNKKRIFVCYLTCNRVVTNTKVKKNSLLYFIILFRIFVSTNVLKTSHMLITIIKRVFKYHERFPHKWHQNPTIGWAYLRKK